MTPQHFETQDVIIQKGEVGSRLYVLAGACFVVIFVVCNNSFPPPPPFPPTSHHQVGKAEVLITDDSATPFSYVNPGEVMGELALLYNCTRTATVRGAI